MSDSCTLDQHLVHEYVNSLQEDLVRRDQKADAVEIMKIIIPIGVAVALGTISMLSAICAKMERTNREKQRESIQKITAQPAIDTNIVQAVGTTLEREN